MAVHFCVSALGQVVGAVKPVTLLSRLGPRHWGQSWALTPPALSSSTQLAITPAVRFAFFMVAPSGCQPWRLPGQTPHMDRNPENAKESRAWARGQQGPLRQGPRTRALGAAARHEDYHLRA